MPVAPFFLHENFAHYVLRSHFRSHSGRREDYRYLFDLAGSAETPGPPQFAVTIPPAFAAYLLLVGDWRARGRPRAVYVIGVAMLAVLALAQQTLRSFVHAMRLMLCKETCQRSFSSGRK
jgi:hypothetical protein